MPRKNMNGANRWVDNARIRQRALRRLMLLHEDEFRTLLHEEQHKENWAHIHAAGEHQHSGGKRA